MSRAGTWRGRGSFERKKLAKAAPSIHSFFIGYSHDVNQSEARRTNTSLRSIQGG
jgi:hypothetical protein